MLLLLCKLLKRQEWLLLEHDDRSDCRIRFRIHLTLKFQWKHPETIDRQRVNSLIRLSLARFLCDTILQMLNSDNRCQILVSSKK